MTTSLYSTTWEHTSDATFRDWGSALSAAFLAVGLTQTADTGQINWTTVTRPGTNTAAGYEIYTFSDTLNATKPVYMKIEYGTTANTSMPGMWATVGTGSNGAGTITGTVSARQQLSTNANIGSTVTSYPTYVCYKDGHFAFALKVGSANTTQAHAIMCVTRTSDSAGADSGDGIAFYYGITRTSALSQQPISFLTSTAYTAHTQYSLRVGAVTSSSFGGSNFQVYKHFTITPQCTPLIGIASVLTAELGAGATFSLALVGATARTYLGLNTAQTGMSADSSTAMGMAILWE